MTHQIQKTLGPESAKLLEQLLRAGIYIFNTDQAAEISQKNRVATNSMLSMLCKKGLLSRIKKGHYLILQIGQETTQLSNWPVIARVLADESPYFISHYSAMRLHGMTTHALNIVTITMQKRVRNKTIQNILYQFIYKKPHDFWGIYSYWVDKQNKIMLSDLERTILDALDQPHLCGGITEIVRGIEIKREQIDWNKLISYAKKFPKRSAIKRLGFILDALHLANKQLETLEMLSSAVAGYVLLDPSLPKSGKYINRWKVQANINTAELIASNKK